MNILKALFGNSTRSLTATEAKARIESGQPLIILDVRQSSEFRNGHINGAILIPLNELSRRMDELSKETEILCVCHSGSRSRIAVGQLTNAGFNAINLQGGMMNWQTDGYPIKKGQ